MLVKTATCLLGGITALFFCDSCVKHWAMDHGLEIILWTIVLILLNPRNCLSYWMCQSSGVSQRNQLLMFLLCFCVQDTVFRLEPHVENGRGKSPYDPKLLTASMLLGEFKERMHGAALLGVTARSYKNLGVTKTPLCTSALSFHLM